MSDYIRHLSLQLAKYVRDAPEYGKSRQILDTSTATVEAAGQ